MLISPYITELSSDDETVADKLEFSMLEIDDDEGQLGMTIEEIVTDDFNEDLASEGSVETFSTSEPFIEEPDDQIIEKPQLIENIEIFYDSSPLALQPTISTGTTIKDLFELARYHIDIADSTGELWFQIEPLGLEVGEDNSFTYEPTMGDLLKLLDSPAINCSKGEQPYLRINVECRESFYQKFQDLIKDLSLNDNSVATSSGTQSKRRRT